MLTGMIVETDIRNLEGGVSLVSLRGRLNLGNLLQRLEHQLEDLIEGGTRKLVVDLSGLERTDSAGMGVLMQCAGRMEAAGGQMRIAGASGAVASAFGVVHMDRLVPLDSKLEESVAALGGTMQSQAGAA
jgi:anti-sigma B factor antagonist